MPCCTSKGPSKHGGRCCQWVNTVVGHGGATRWRTRGTHGSAQTLHHGPPPFQRNRVSTGPNKPSGQTRGPRGTRAAAQPSTDPVFPKAPKSSTAQTFEASRFALGTHPAARRRGAPRRRAAGCVPRANRLASNVWAVEDFGAFGKTGSVEGWAAARVPRGPRVCPEGLFGPVETRFLWKGGGPWWRVWAEPCVPRVRHRVAPPCPTTVFTHWQQRPPCLEGPLLVQQGMCVARVPRQSRGPRVCPPVEAGLVELPHC